MTTLTQTGLNVQLTRLHGPLNNYGVLIHDQTSGMTASVDCGDADPILELLDQNGWTLDHLWVSHHHPDHTAGIAALKQKTGCTVFGPSGSRQPIAGIDAYVAGGDTITFGGYGVGVLHTPGHTLDMLNFHIAEAGLLFAADTLFVMGCGRLFEGTPDQMYQSLMALAALPDETIVYCAHEYTLDNAAFAARAFPANAAIAARSETMSQLRQAGLPTIPTTIGAEKATNPFLLALDGADFARLRAAKDKG